MDPETFSVGDSTFHSIRPQRPAERAPLTFNKATSAILPSVCRAYAE